jgi:hypothetical protein
MMTVRVVVNPCGDEAPDRCEIDLAPDESTAALTIRLASLYNHSPGFFLL